MSSEIINTSVEEYKKLVESLHSEYYEMMVYLTVVDWFRKKEPRFEIIVQFVQYSLPIPKIHQLIYLKKRHPTFY